MSMEENDMELNELEIQALDIANLVFRKNKSYGFSFAKTGTFLQLLYPEGIKPEQYADALLITRIFDKLMRIATNKEAFEENPYDDIVGYGLLGKNLGEK